MTTLHMRPKPGAFDPSPHSELSVAHSTDLPSDEIWGIGALTLGMERGRDRIYGRADVSVLALIEERLRVVRDDAGFRRHTSVKGWPESSNADERKQLRKQICLELCLDPGIKLVVPPSPIVKS